MLDNYQGVTDSKAYSITVNKMRDFFRDNGWREVHTQDRLSILAACEDPSTVADFNYAGKRWPLPQTGQMWLEYELIKDDTVPGVFTVSTSYRNEPNPVAGRHEILFPMFEFESRGDMDDMIDLEKELLNYMGFGDESEFAEKTYAELAEYYGVDELGHEHEHQMAEDIAPATFIKDFPELTSPYWNMKRYDDSDLAKKVDCILYGQETIGSAERSQDPEVMRDRFYAISDGEYAKKLFNLFGKERVEAELEHFLELPMEERFGGGIGMTRMIQAMKAHGLVDRCVAESVPISGVHFILFY
jgi:aspartyl/asparaginyl-tRNA synthetase